MRLLLISTISTISTIFFLSFVSSLIPALSAQVVLQQREGQVDSPALNSGGSTEEANGDGDNEIINEDSIIQPSSSSATNIVRPPSRPEQQERGHWGKPISQQNQIDTAGDIRTTTNTNATIAKQPQEEQPIPFVPLASRKRSTNDNNTVKNKMEPHPEKIKETMPSHPKKLKKNDSVLSHTPPAGYTLTAHIVTNPHDGKSYFTTPDGALPDQNLLIPFLECGAAGSTTQGIPTGKAFFQHFPKSARPMDFVAAKEPHLLICLNELEIMVSGSETDKEEGEIRVFQRGSVILVEDVLSEGHKMYSNEGDVSVMSLTLPPSCSQKKENTKGLGSKAKFGGRVKSLFSRFGNEKEFNINQTDKTACHLKHSPAYCTLGVTEYLDEENYSKFQYLLGGNIPRKNSWWSTSRLPLGITGAALSTQLAIFLSKVVPHYLSIVTGFGCVVGCGTCGFVIGAETLCNKWKLRTEKDRLRDLTVIEEDKEGEEGQEEKEDRLDLDEGVGENNMDLKDDDNGKNA